MNEFEMKPKCYKYGVSSYTECVKNAMQKYNKKPEIIEKRREYQKEVYHKLIIDPDYKNYIRARERLNYQKRKERKILNELIIN